MTKMFFDVFPTLEVNGDMKKLLSETEVTRVGMNHEKDHIRIYLNGTRLIHKKNIYQLEKNIHDQIFKNRHMDVKVIEKYQLSEQYTAEKLMDLYKDSILEELKNYSLMEYNLLRSAKMEFTGDSHLLLTLENTIIAQTRSHEIVEFLEKVVCERCGLDLSVELAFGGGKGTLELMEDEDVLEAGIRIIAQPPGKKLQNMMQLSGGEKALTAISLLFAIQNLKPSPFCLLDEIEAALDDSNVDRYAQYLHKLTKHTQFIVITHRRGTMAAADRLYGITMQEKGISTLVSVDLVEEQLEKERKA